ncbi:MAG TPA: cation transporter [Bacteroidales bacterium]|nr:cation transporter [Bacteroidales bacterium]
MVNFLIHRPIAVIMVFLAILFLGIITFFQVPVSLMPDIDIPEITVQTTYSGIPAREMENTVVSRLRNQLLQVAHLENIESETRDGYGMVRMKFTHGTDINYAYIECNEKIDDAMEGLPRGLDRPRVVKASATDIPVFNLMITHKTEWANPEKLVELSEFIKAVIVKRIEQLPEVAMVDLTGSMEPELVIKPDNDKMKSLGLTDQDILRTLESNSASIGNLMVREGYYQYHIQFTNYLKNLEDVANLYLGSGDRMLQIKEIAELEIRPQERRGIFLNREKTGLCLALIKQSDARMEDLKSELDKLIVEYQKNYPELNFEIEKDQTKILTYSIGNLKQSLWSGALLAMIVMFLFLKDFRSPVLIAFSIPISLIVCFLLFYLFGISMNIISLSGLVLAVGMMIDNSIIVIDNINQYLDRGESIHKACVHGTNEVIRPLISSGLTTCAVFIPLVFLSGISGALFYDQAIAVAIGLTSSFLVSITLIPTLFRLFFVRNPKAANNSFLSRINKIDYEKAYEQSFSHVFKYRAIYLTVFVLLLLVTYPLYRIIGVSQFPEMDQTEVVTVLDWNEPVHVEENARRVESLMQSLPDSILQFSGMVGEQQFILSREAERTASEAEVYFRLNNPDSVDRVIKHIQDYLSRYYPLAKVSFHPPENIFEAIFSSDMPELLTQLTSLTSQEQPPLEDVWRFTDSLARTGGLEFVPVPVHDQIVIEVDPERLLLYKVTFSEITDKLEKAFNQKRIGILKTYQRFIPILLATDQKSVIEIVNQTFVRNADGKEYALSSLVTLGHEQQYKTIRASRIGEFVPLEARSGKGSVPQIMQEIRDGLRNSTVLQADFTGTWFSQKTLMRELMLVLLISVLLLYFILAAQFESFLQPLIVLVELPIDIAAAFLMLWIFGETLNLMSAIGIIVMAGIIINDSILKIDTINRTRAAGHTVLEAVHIAGMRRLKPIIMTSLTTVLGLAPFLFFKGLGSDLQKPLALAIMGGMTIGTLVSIYIVPIVYWAAYRKEDRKRLQPED